MCRCDSMIRYLLKTKCFRRFSSAAKRHLTRDVCRFKLRIQFQVRHSTFFGGNFALFVSDSLSSVLVFSRVFCSNQASPRQTLHGLFRRYSPRLRSTTDDNTTASRSTHPICYFFVGLIAAFFNALSTKVEDSEIFFLNLVNLYICSLSVRQ